jgi:hypothetical protein
MHVRHGRLVRKQVLICVACAGVVLLRGSFICAVESFNFEDGCLL